MPLKDKSEFCSYSIWSLVHVHHRTHNINPRLPIGRVYVTTVPPALVQASQNYWVKFVELLPLVTASSTLQRSKLEGTFAYLVKKLSATGGYHEERHLNRLNSSFSTGPRDSWCRSGNIHALSSEDSGPNPGYDGGYASQMDSDANET